MAYTKIVDALRSALIEEMDRDPNVVLLGEDIAVFNGSFLSSVTWSAPTIFAISVAVIISV